LKRQIITTADGSSTIQIEEWNEQYHSVHGAIQEANHVFMTHGLFFYAETYPEKKDLSILEIGFGTGLNALITLLETSKLKLKTNYVGVEAFPVTTKEVTALNYAQQLKVDANIFTDLHNCTWENPEQITSDFCLTKQKKEFKDIADALAYDLIYFDAFGAQLQPELWTEAIFKLMFDAIKPNGVLVTYSAKGSVRRAMQAVGFSVERLPGPPGKREMLRAQKLL